MIAALALALWFALGLQTAPTDDLARAHAAYRASDFAAAFEAFTRALDDPRLPRAEVLFNLGNCAHGLGRPAEAVLHYRRALRYAPSDAETTANLRLVERQLGLFDADSGEPDAGFATALRTSLDAVPEGILLALASILQLVGLLGLLAAVHRRTRFAASLIAGLLIGTHVAVGAFAPSPPVAVVLREDSRVRSEPHADMANTASLRAGQAVRVLEASDRWARIEHARGQGWTERANLELVDAARPFPRAD